MIVDELELVKSIGKGAFGEVYYTVNKLNGEIYATKRMEKDKIKGDAIEKYFNNEIYILSHVHHQNVIKLYELKQTLRCYYLVTEYCNGGSLQSALKKYIKRYNRPFTQQMVQYLMNQIVSGVHYLHNNNIIHRDLKLDNILIKFNNDTDLQNLNIMACQAKIIDFGFARFLSKNNLCQSVLGSPINMDPLILKKFGKEGGKKFLAYDQKADIYSLGTLCYEMFTGVPPFQARDCDELIAKVDKGDYSIPTNLRLSKESISFLNGMMKYEPSERLNVNELIRHEFLTKDVSKFTEIDINSIYGNKIPMNIKEKSNNVIWNLFESKNMPLESIDPRMLSNGSNKYLNGANVTGNKNNPAIVPKDYKPFIGNEGKPTDNKIFNEYDKKRPLTANEARAANGFNLNQIPVQNGINNVNANNGIRNRNDYFNQLGNELNKIKAFKTQELSNPNSNNLFQNQQPNNIIPNNKLVNHTSPNRFPQQQTANNYYPQPNYYRGNNQNNLQRIQSSPNISPNIKANNGGEPANNQGTPGKQAEVNVQPIITGVRKFNFNESNPELDSIINSLFDRVNKDYYVIEETMIPLKIGDELRVKEHIEDLNEDKIN